MTRDEFRTFARSVEARFDRSDENQRTFGILLERVAANVTVLAEGQSTLRDQLKRDMRDLEARLSERIEKLEAAVRQHSLELQHLSKEVAELRDRFDRRDGTLEEHERRLTELEKLAGFVSDYPLRSAVARD